MKILLDFDSTTADLIGHQIACCNGRFGTDYTFDQVTDWNWWFDHADPEHSSYVWGNECFLSRTWTMDMPPVDGAIEGIEELIDSGHTLVLVSDRSPLMRSWLEDWLWRYGLRFPVYTTNRSGPTKLDMIKELGLEYVIEDAPHHAVELSMSGWVDGVLLLDKPWNRDIEMNSQIERCANWEHILDCFALMSLLGW